MQDIPQWAAELSAKYQSNTITQFILHDNVRDLMPVHSGKDSSVTAFVPFSEYLATEIFRDRDIVMYYDISKGIYFPDKAMHSQFYSTMQIQPQDVMKVPSLALRAIEIYLRLSTEKNKSVAVILDHADMIAPASAFNMSHEDRKCLVTLLRWAYDVNLLEKKITVCLITDNLSGLNTKLIRNASTEKIEVEYPVEKDRATYIQWHVGQNGGDRFESYSEVTAETIAKTTAGLNRKQLGLMLSYARENKKKITFSYLVKMKKEIIEEECYGLLEVIEPGHTLDSVAGHEGAKKKLRQLSSAIRGGNLDAVPMGYLFSGPVGTGKTFMVLSFVGEIGIPCVKFKNFREKWQGVTESNLEKILNLLKAMWPIGVVIDEADAFLGDRSSEGDSGTTSRIFSQLSSFMGDTSYRGKVIWFLITCRPDLLPIDLKRQGRAEEHISLFFPDTADDKEALFRAMIRKVGLEVSAETRLADVFDLSQTISGADLEAMLTRVKLDQNLSGVSGTATGELKAHFSDFIPANDPDSIELQNLAAVLECTSRDLLPQRYREISRNEIKLRFDQLQHDRGR